MIVKKFPDKKRFGVTVFEDGSTRSLSYLNLCHMSDGRICGESEMPDVDAMSVREFEEFLRSCEDDGSG